MSTDAPSRSNAFTSRPSDGCAMSATTATTRAASNAALTRAASAKRSRRGRVRTHTRQRARGVVVPYEARDRARRASGARARRELPSRGSPSRRQQRHRRRRLRRVARATRRRAQVGFDLSTRGKSSTGAPSRPPSLARSAAAMRDARVVASRSSHSLVQSLAPSAARQTRRARPPRRSRCRSSQVRLATSVSAHSGKRTPATKRPCAGWPRRRARTRPPPRRARARPPRGSRRAVERGFVDLVQHARALQLLRRRERAELVPARVLLRCDDDDPARHVRRSESAARPRGGRRGARVRRPRARRRAVGGRRGHGERGDARGAPRGVDDERRRGAPASSASAASNAASTASGATNSPHASFDDVAHAPHVTVSLSGASRARAPTSPVAKKPSATNASAVARASRQYPEKSAARARISPRSVVASESAPTSGRARRRTSTPSPMTPLRAIACAPVDRGPRSCARRAPPATSRCVGASGRRARHRGTRARGRRRARARARPRPRRRRRRDARVRSARAALEEARRRAAASAARARSTPTARRGRARGRARPRRPRAARATSTWCGRVVPRRLERDPRRDVARGRAPAVACARPTRHGSRSRPWARPTGGEHERRRRVGVSVGGRRFRVGTVVVGRRAAGVATRHPATAAARPRLAARVDDNRRRAPGARPRRRAIRRARPRPG